MQQILWHFQPWQNLNFDSWAFPLTWCFSFCLYIENVLLCKTLSELVSPKKWTQLGTTLLNFRFHNESFHFKANVIFYVFVVSFVKSVLIGHYVIRSIELYYEPEKNTVKHSLITVGLEWTVRGWLSKQMSDSRKPSAAPLCELGSCIEDSN